MPTVEAQRRQRWLAHDLVVLERKNPLVVHTANLAELIKAEGENAARAKCVGIARAFRSNRGNVGASEREYAKEDF